MCTRALLLLFHYSVEVKWTLWHLTKTTNTDHAEYKHSQFAVINYGVEVE